MPSTRISLRLACTFATGLSWANCHSPTAFPLPTGWSCRLPQERSRKTDLDFVGCFTEKTALCQHVEVAGKLGKRWTVGWETLLFGDRAVLDQSSLSQLQNSPSEICYMLSLAEPIQLHSPDKQKLPSLPAWQGESAQGQRNARASINSVPRLRVDGGWREERAGSSHFVNSKLLSQLLCNFLTCNSSLRCRIRHTESRSHPYQPNGPSYSVHQHGTSLGLTPRSYHPVRQAKCLFKQSRFKHLPLYWSREDELAPGEALTWAKHRLVQKDFELFANRAGCCWNLKSFISKMSNATFLCMGKLSTP